MSITQMHCEIIENDAFNHLKAPKVSEILIPGTLNARWIVAPHRVVWVSINTAGKSHCKVLTVNTRELNPPFHMKYWDLCQHFIKFRSDILIIEIFFTGRCVFFHFFSSLKMKRQRKKNKDYKQSSLAYSVFMGTIWSVATATQQISLWIQDSLYTLMNRIVQL